MGRLTDAILEKSVLATEAAGILETETQGEGVVVPTEEATILMVGEMSEVIQDETLGDLVEAIPPMAANSNSHRLWAELGRDREVIYRIIWPELIQTKRS